MIEPAAATNSAALGGASWELGKLAAIFKNILCFNRRFRALPPPLGAFAAAKPPLKFHFRFKRPGIPASVLRDFQ